MTTASTLSGNASDAIAWTAEHERVLFGMQVAELYGLAPFAAGSAFAGAALTYAVLIDTGESLNGLYWFSLFTCLTIFRVAAFMLYERAQGADPEFWARLSIVGNLFAGVLWGALGSVLFPDTPSYRELFTVMVIACYVGGSVATYASVKWAHAALAVPAIVPAIVHLTLMRDGFHVYSAVLATVFLFMAIGIANKLHKQTVERLRLTMERGILIDRLQYAMDQLAQENRDLAHRAAVRLRSARAAQDRASMLAAHFDHLPIPMIECDAELRVLDWNDAARRLLGWPLDDVRGNNFLKLVMEDEFATPNTAKIVSAARASQPSAVYGLFRDQQGVERHGTFSAVPNFPADGTPGRIALVVTDIQLVAA
jgi:PAS domain S-box-containing protein